jgi:hypothetical protein
MSSCCQQRGGPRNEQHACLLRKRACQSGAVVLPRSWASLGGPNCRKCNIFQHLSALVDVRERVALQHLENRRRSCTSNPALSTDISTSSGRLKRGDSPLLPVASVLSNISLEWVRDWNGLVCREVRARVQNVTNCKATMPFCCAFLCAISRGLEVALSVRIVSVTQKNSREFRFRSVNVIAI